MLAKKVAAMFSKATAFLAGIVFIMLAWFVLAIAQSRVSLIFHLKADASWESALLAAEAENDDQ